MASTQTQRSIGARRGPAARPPAAVPGMHTTCTLHSPTLLPCRCTLVRAADVRRVQTPLPTPLPTADLKGQEDFTRDADTVSSCVELLRSYARSHAQGDGGGGGGDDGDGGGVVGAAALLPRGDGADGERRRQRRPFFLYCDLDYPHAPYWDRQSVEAAAPRRAAAVNRSAVPPPAAWRTPPTHPYDLAMSVARGVVQPPPEAAAGDADRTDELGGGGGFFGRDSDVFREGGGGGSGGGRRGGGRGASARHAAAFRAAHLAKCAQADAFAGEVLRAAAALQRTTLVAVASDHGARRCGSNTRRLQPCAVQAATLCVQPATPRIPGEMRLEHGTWQKASLYEASSRVALLLRAPGTPPDASVRAATAQRVVSLTQLYPTLLAAADGAAPAGASVPPGAASPATGAADARQRAGSLLPLLYLTGRRRPELGLERGVAVAQYHGPTAPTGACMLRLGRHKLLAYGALLGDDDEAWAAGGGGAGWPQAGWPSQLFDVETDPHEATDLAPRQPRLVAQLQREMARAGLDCAGADRAAKAHDYKLWAAQEVSQGVSQGVSREAQWPAWAPRSVEGAVAAASADEELTHSRSCFAAPLSEADLAAYNPSSASLQPT